MDVSGFRETTVLINHFNWENTMQTENPPVYAFKSHAEADEAVRALGKSGFDVTKLSIVGTGYHTEEKLMGFYTAGDRIKSWGASGAFWGGIWGLLLAPAVFLIPGLGVVAMAGPVVATLVGGLEGAVVVGGASALVAALTQGGFAKDHALKVEAALKVDQYLLIVHGDALDAAQVSAVLGEAKTLETA